MDGWGGVLEFGLGWVECCFVFKPPGEEEVRRSVALNE